MLVYAVVIRRKMEYISLVKGKTDKIRSKRIFSANRNDSNNVFFLTTREQKNVHIWYVTQTCLCVLRYESLLG